MTPKIRVTAVLIEDETILLVRQKVDESRGWSLPGGTLERGETIETCLKREMREETGLEVEVERLLYLCDRITDTRHVVHLTFTVKRAGGVLTVGGEPEPGANLISDARMVPLRQLADYGFSERFQELAEEGFPAAGTYQGRISHIGL